MSIQFQSSAIENNAIWIVIEQLSPYLKYDPDSEFRILDLEKEGVEEKHIDLYKQIFIPYISEYRKHFQLHHSGFLPESWAGEQTCLSMIHFLNEKAWWLLHYYAVDDALRLYNKGIPKSKLNQIVTHMAHSIVDNNMSVGDAVACSISKELKPKRHEEERIINAIKDTIEPYQNAPSHPMIYR